MTTETYKQYQQASIDGTLLDDNNPIFIFQQTALELLTKIAIGELDAKELAELELMNRGYNWKGEFVGFKYKWNGESLKKTAFIEWTIKDVLKQAEEDKVEINEDDATIILSYQRCLDDMTLSEAISTYVNKMEDMTDEDNEL